MNTYVYEAMRAPEETVTGEIEAEDESSAAATLLNRGYHVLRIENASSGAASRPRVGMWGGLKRRDLTRFTRDLAILLKSGLPLAQGLLKLRERSRAGGWNTIAGGLRSRLEDGQTLSQAMANYPEVFDAIFVSLVKAGEEGGNLAAVLVRLADMSERRDELRARVRMALVYPAVMAALGVVTVVVLLTFVVPMFSDVFEESGQALPLPTQLLVDGSTILIQWWWLIVGVSVALGVALYRLAQSERGRGQTDKLLLRVPSVGSVLHKSERASFARTLGTLLDNGIPMVRALGITAATQRNRLYQLAVAEMDAAVRDGERLSRSVAASNLFPDMMASVIGVGEDGGMLDETLLQLAEEYERDVEREVKVLMTLLEPAMIVVVGLVVGFIVMAMLLPIFDLGQAIQP